MAKKKVKLVIDEVVKREAEEQIKELQKEIDYDLRDFTIDYIVKEFGKDRFYIPDYQREYVWDTVTRTRFIESVILGLPIPFMFFADTDDGRLEIVDGAQRIQTLESFYTGDLELEKLERLKKLNGFKFLDLPLAQQRKFENRALRVIILEDKTSVEIRHEIFNRINTAGKKANPSEIRKGAFSGPFMNFIDKCSKDPMFIKLTPISQSLVDRGEPQEFVLRFFAYLERYKEFKHDVANFLNKFVKDNKETYNEQDMLLEFQRMLEFVDKYFPNGFAKSATAKSTPRVRFESIAIGVALALREDPNLKPKSMEWLDSEEFKFHTTTHASNSSTRLQGRIDYVKNSLLKVRW